jgi:hypothetical protein
LLPLDAAIPHTLALHLPDGAGFVFALRVLADPDEEDLCVPRGRGPWSDGDEVSGFSCSRGTWTGPL